MNIETVSETAKPHIWKRIPIEKRKQLIDLFSEPLSDKELLMEYEKIMLDEQSHPLKEKMA